MRALQVVVLALVAVPWASPAYGQVAPTDVAITLLGVVVDQSGAVVASATVDAPGTPVVRVATTGADGRFAIDIRGGRPSTLRVGAVGFASVEVTIPAKGEVAPLRVVLVPASLDEAVTVTASRGAVTTGGAATTAVVSGAALISSGAGAIDDALRLTPGFSLFRRSTSRVANPTTQGVTLRGVSGSGASRSSVLADGITLNDPFGSWVYWNRIPLASIDRIEVMRGAGGDLYGAEALGGVVQIVTLDAGARPAARLVAEYGTQETSRLSGVAAARWRAWSATATGEWYDTAGAFVVADADRGAIDARAASQYATSGASLAWRGRAWQAAARVRASDEQRANGTPLQVNDTNWRQWSGDVSGHAGGGQWSVRGMRSTQGYYQTFSAILAARASERLTSEQRIPTNVTRGQAQWARAWTRAAILVGAEGHRTRAAQTERRYGTTGALIEQAVTGGTERAVGVFARVSFTPRPAVTIGAGARVDRARTTPRVASLAEQTSTNVHPRANVTWRASDRWTAHAAAYRSSRTPTLNERYRAFRVGNVVTNANSSLDPERLTGVEAGIGWRVRALTARATGYWNSLDDAVTNVTLSSTPAQTTRQRQNTDTLRARGVEFETEWRPAGWLTVTAAAVTGRARFHHAPAQPQLVGNDVPQVPRYQWSAGAIFTGAPLGTLTFQMRRVGRQFDDDVNALALASFSVVDAAVSRHIARGVAVSLAVENLLDAEYDVGRTPTRSIGWPRALRVGVRFWH